MTNKLLITGATGFIGQKLVEYLFNKNYKIICLIREKSDINFLKKNRIKYIYNYRSKELNNVDIIIHLAGVINAKTRDEFYESNIETTKKVLDFASKNKIKKIIFLSTAVAKPDVKEDYANTKFIAEQLIKKSKINYVIIKASLVYGKGDKRHIGALINLIKKYYIIPIIGDGNYLLQPVFIDDLIYAIFIAIEKNEIKNKTYFIAGPKTITFNNIVTLISNSIGVKRLKIHVPEFVLILLSGIYEKFVKNPKVTQEQIKRITSDKIYDISCAIKDMKYNPINFEKGIIKTIN